MRVELAYGGLCVSLCVRVRFCVVSDGPGLGGDIAQEEKRVFEATRCVRVC